MPTRRVELILVFAVLVAAVVWMDLSSLHRFTNADSLMMSLVSLYKWTPMFWEQNRLGMLVPALAMPFRHPLTNMLVQGGLTTLSGLGSFYLLGYYVAGHRRGLTIGSLAALLFVLTQAAWQRFCYFIYIYQFHVSISLALLGLLASVRWQRSRHPWEPPIAVACLWLALWVNPTLVFAVGPLILLRRFLLGDAAQEFDRLDEMPPGLSPASPRADFGRVLEEQPASARPSAPWRRWALGFPASDWLALAATATGLLVSMAVSQFAADSQEQYAFLPPREWLACALGVLKDLTHQLHVRWFLAVTFIAATGLLTLVWPSGRKAVRMSAGIAIGLLIPAIFQFGFVTSVDHVHRTDFGHYAFVAAFLWQGALLTFAVLQWAAVLPDRPVTRRVPWVLLALFMIVVAARHGRPGVGVVRAALQESIGKYAPRYWHPAARTWQANIGTSGRRCFTPTCCWPTVASRRRSGGWPFAANPRASVGHACRWPIRASPRSSATNRTRRAHWQPTGCRRWL